MMDKPESITWEGFLEIFRNPLPLAILLIATLLLLFFLLAMTNKKFGNYVMGMFPGFSPKDEKGNPIPRKPGQWVGMMVLAVAVVLAIVY